MFGDAPGSRRAAAMMEQMGDSASRVIIMNTKSEEIIVDPTKMDLTKFANLNRCGSCAVL
jgi:hypothetical protein